MIEELFVPYNEAKSLEGLGFNEPCFMYYDEEYMFGKELLQYSEASCSATSDIVCWHGETTDISAVTNEQLVMLGSYCGDGIEDENGEEGTFNRYTAPTYQQALEWIKDKHGIWGVVLPTETLGTWCYYWYDLEQKPRDNDEFLLDSFRTYEEAKLFLLQKLIKFLTNKQKQ